MRTIGLTGSIACGKSNVSAVLRELGAAVVDGDLLSRELTAPGGPALPAIRETFGDGVFHADGTLNRRALGDVVFASDAGQAARRYACWTCRYCSRRGWTRCATQCGACICPGRSSSGG